MHTSRTWSESFKYAIAAAAYVALVVAPLARPAHADTFSTAMGMQSELGPICYQFGFNSEHPGANKIETTECFNNQFILPVAWKTFPAGNRTLTVRGKVWFGDSLLGCQTVVVNSNGTIVSQASASLDPALDDVMQTITMTVNSVTSSTTTYVTCSAIGGSHHVLTNYSYTP